MYKESTLHIIAISFFWSLMEKTVRGLCVCARVCACTPVYACVLIEK